MISDDFMNIGCLERIIKLFYKEKMETLFQFFFYLKHDKNICIISNDLSVTFCD